MTAPSSPANHPVGTGYQRDEDDRSRAASELAAAWARLTGPTKALFSGPAPTTDDAAARHDLAADIARRAGLLPWPEWAAVRHGPGHGAHLLGIVAELGETGRAGAVIVVALAPLAASLSAHLKRVATDAGLELAVIDLDQSMTGQEQPGQQPSTPEGTGRPG